jgi:hypothetical protein
MRCSVFNVIFPTAKARLNKATAVEVGNEDGDCEQAESSGNQIIITSQETGKLYKHSCTLLKNYVQTFTKLTGVKSCMYFLTC